MGLYTTFDLMLHPIEVQRAPKNTLSCATDKIKSKTYIKTGTALWCFRGTLVIE